MGTPGLSEFLRQQRDDLQHSAEANRLLREAWVKEVDELLTKIEEWLAPEKKEGLLEVVRTPDVTVQEERLGTYAAPALEIRAGTRTINVLPIARLVFGGAGRVDLTYGPRIKVLMLADPTAKAVYSPDDGPRKVGPLKWMISAPDPRDRGVELNQESLSDAIQFLLS